MKLLVIIEGEIEPTTVGALIAAAVSVAHDPSRKAMALGWDTGDTWLRGHKNKKSWTLLISKPAKAGE